MIHHICLLIFLSKILFRCILSVPVRVIVDASEGSPQSSPEHYEFRYSPVFEQSTKARKQRPKKTHEERLESFRERYKILRAENPEYLKEKSRKGYIKRRKDPEKLARDQKYFKLYRDSNRAKMNEYQREYKRRKKEKEQQQNEKGKESITRKRKGSNSENDQTANKKINKQNSKSDQTTTTSAQDSRKPIIARLKVSSETVEKFYGPSQSTHLTPVRTIVDADYQSESGYLGKVPSQPNNKMKSKPKKRRGERRSYEEKLRVNRERKRQSYLTNPEYHKNLNRKTYLKRKADPVKMANDATKRKAYKAGNRGKIASRQRQYYLNRKAKEQQEKMQDAENLKPEKEGNESYHGSLNPTKKMASTEATNTSTRRPIIARLKLSSETINTFYGKQSSPTS